MARARVSGSVVSGSIEVVCTSAQATTMNGECEKLSTSWVVRVHSQRRVVLASCFLLRQFRSVSIQTKRMYRPRGKANRRLALMQDSCPSLEASCACLCELYQEIKPELQFSCVTLLHRNRKECLSRYCTVCYCLQSGQPSI